MPRQSGPFDVLIAGGGIIGIAVGYGLARKGIRVAVVDSTPQVDKASRANMGLIWCQSKGLGQRKYRQWGFESSARFRTLITELEEISGIDTGYRPSGGIIPCLGEQEYEQRAAYLKKLYAEEGAQANLGEMLSRQALEKKLPAVRFGPEVTGGTWCEADGFLDPLCLLFALRRAFTVTGGTLLTDTRITCLQHEAGSYRVSTEKGRVECDRLVLAGGLGNRQLARHFAMKIPVIPNRSQVFLTERIPDILPIPLLGITRTPGGTVMVGFEHEFVCTDTGFSPEAVARTGQWAARIWPALAELRIIRCWSALRVWPIDGLPVYDTLPGHEKAYVLTTHSAVTFTPLHTDLLPDYILGGPVPELATEFTLDRFADQKKAA